MAQCKEPLDWQEPNINICIYSKGHEGSHFTYGLGWGYIYYNGKADHMPVGDNFCAELETLVRQRLSEILGYSAWGDKQIQEMISILQLLQGYRKVR